MSINFKKVGSLTKVEVTGLSTQYYETLETSFDFVVYEDGTNRIKFTIDAPNKASLTRTVLLTDIKVDGVSVTNKADFDIRIATVFPEANSGSGDSSAWEDLEGLPEDNQDLVDYVADNAGGGGSGLVLESYQNSAMSAAVMALVFRDADDNIFRVIEPLRGNDIQGENIDDFPFDNVDWTKNTFMAGAILSNVPITSVITGNVLHPKAAIYGGGRRVEITDSFLDSRAAIYVLKPNLTVVSATLLSQSKLAISGITLDVFAGVSSEIGTFGNGGGVDLVSINTGTKTFKILGDVVADVKSIVRIFTLGASSVNEGYYTVVSATLNAGNTDVVVTEAIPSSTIGETQIQLISVFGSLSYITLKASSFLVATTDLVNADTVDIGSNIYYPVSGDIEGKTLINIGGDGYELGEAAGSVTATPV